MAQITDGIRAVLSFPPVYNALQNIMGAKKVRGELVSEFIRPTPRCRVLDLGCGTADILQHLPADVEYYGYDMSARYIAAARARYGERGNFQCALLDEAGVAALPKFDCVLALGVLHHLEDEQARDLFSLACNALREGGRLITIDPCLAEEQSAIARWLILKDRGQNVRDSQGYTALLGGEKDRQFAHVEGALRHRKWIPYTHWIMECSR